jgi:hypothetical protein
MCGIQSAVIISQSGPGKTGGDEAGPKGGTSGGTSADCIPPGGLESSNDSNEPGKRDGLIMKILNLMICRGGWEGSRQEPEDVRMFVMPGMKVMVALG